MKRLFIRLAAMTAALVLAAAGCASAENWRDTYRRFISSGSYQPYIRAADPEFTEIAYERDTQWDSFACYDMDLDGVPELLVRSDYGYEQIDVFTCSGDSARWLGTMGGTNFFQWILCYDGAGVRGKLYTMMGGPVMTVDEYRLSRAGVVKRSLGRTVVDWSSEETVGLDLYDVESSLEQLLRGSLVSGRDRAEYLTWQIRNKLRRDSDWDSLFRMARSTR